MTKVDTPITNRIVHVYDDVEGALYIGRAMPRKGLRASKWANPYKIGIHGNRQEVLYAYTFYVAASGLFFDLPELRDQTFACWCRHEHDQPSPDNGCHGDILAVLLSMHTDEEIKAMQEQGRRRFAA